MNVVWKPSHCVKKSISSLISYLGNVLDMKWWGEQKKARKRRPPRSIGKKM
jgi:hypothetical protein